MDPIVYKKKPNTQAPYSSGSLTDETLNSAIKMINQIRYIAGISNNVILSKEATEEAQGASLVNAVNRFLTHFPKKPSGMDEALYQLGARGARSSNIAMSCSTINSSILYGYMNDVTLLTLIGRA